MITNYICEFKNKITNKNCPLEFIIKKTVNPWTLITLGGLIWLAASVIVSALLKPFLPTREWMDVYVFIIKIVLILCLFYFVKQIGINTYMVAHDWWQNKSWHLRIVVKYFIRYSGFIILVVGILAAIFLLLEKTGKISPFVTADLVKEINPNNKMAQLKFMLEKSIPRFIFSLFSMCIFAPIIEEIFFRRFLFVALRKKINFVPALFISTVFFMVVHPSIPLGAIGGIYLGYVYEKGKSLPANILIHSVVNFTTIILTIALI